jgi:hypothetical protein
MTYVRFYEKNPTVNQAVTNLLSFPADIRSVMARGMCAIAEADFNAHIHIQDFKSLGKEKVLALYKSQSKRREYDTDPYLSKAMNYLMILEPSDQFFLALRINDLTGAVQEFINLCKEYAQTVQLAIVERITNIYVRCGLNETQDLLATLHTKFKYYFSKNTEASSAPLPVEKNSVDSEPETQALQPETQPLQEESITIGESGMRVRSEVEPFD